MNKMLNLRLAQASAIESRVALKPGDFNVPQMLRDDASEIERLNAKVEIDKITMDNFLGQLSDKDAKIERLTKELKRLWCLLDDISTAGDAFKPEINPYFKYVNRKAEDRHGIITSDGYKLFVTDAEADESASITFHADGSISKEGEFPMPASDWIIPNG